MVHVVANANSRYRLPLMPLLIVYASYALVRWSSLRQRLARRTLIAPATVLIYFFLVCVLLFYPDAVSMW